MDRRRFLHLAAAVSGGVLLTGAGLFPTTPDTTPTEPAPSKPAPRPSGASGKNCIIIGAGLAGLACGYELMNAGVSVTILDSRKRVGGRSHSIRDFVKGKTVEAGAEFVGRCHETWVGYAEKFGLKLSTMGEDEDLFQPMFLEGRRLEEKETETVDRETIEAQKIWTAEAGEIDVNAPWKSPRAAELDRISMADKIKELPVGRLTKLYIEADIVGDAGVAADKQSYLSQLAQIKASGMEKFWTDSETYRCVGGSQSLAEKFAEALGNRLRLGAPVKAIDYGDHGVSVTLANGDVLKGNEVVLAVPPTVWSKIECTPPLPAALHPQVGVVMQYLAAVDSRFWEPTKIGPNAITDGILSHIWDATSGQGGESAVMRAYSGGPLALKALANWADSKDKTYRAVIEQIYPGFEKHFVESRFYDWHTDPWTLGGYSFPAPGQLMATGALLQAPLGRLHFAGEHVSTGFPGTMEGALRTGVAIARRLS